MLKRMKIALVVLAVIMMTAGSNAFAYDRIITRHDAHTPVGTLFYILGDIVALPFDLIGSIL